LVFGACVGFVLSYSFAAIYVGRSSESTVTASWTVAPVEPVAANPASLVQQRVKACARQITGSDEKRKLSPAVVAQIEKCAADFMPAVDPELESVHGRKRRLRTSSRRLNIGNALTPTLPHAVNRNMAPLD
jgi:hypothetical protein